jgi:hypothetical protein
LAYKRIKSHAGAIPGTMNTQIVGPSNTSWLLEPKGQGTGPSKYTMTWQVYAAPGTQYVDDSNVAQIAPTYLPVLTMMQAFDKVVDATAAAHDTKNRVLTEQLGPHNLITRAISDLGIQTA